MAKLSVRELVLYGILGAVTFAGKYVMSGLPNIEPVSLMIMVMAVTFGIKCLYPVYVYVVLEMLFYGINIWSVNYLYIWAILAFLAMAFRKMESSLGWAILSGAYGLAFGALCAPVDVFIGGFGYALSKWASGIPFDIAHCLGNFFIALVLFGPMRRLFAKLNKTAFQR